MQVLHIKLITFKLPAIFTHCAFDCSELNVCVFDTVDIGCMFQLINSNIYLIFIILHFSFMSLSEYHICVYMYLCCICTEMCAHDVHVSTCIVISMRLCFVVYFVVFCLDVKHCSLVSFYMCISCII